MLPVRRAVGAGAVLAAIALAITAAVAVATFPGLHVEHDPPVLRIDDTEPIMHNNVVDVSATQRRIVITHADLPIDSNDAACADNDGSSLTMRCKVKGIKRVAIKLRGGADELDLDLSPHHTRLGQLAVGGPDPDMLRGGNGRQELRGGSDADTLRGGRGRDVLNGGAGTDDCKGGPGKDTLINCE
jgi:RTX calcium-binding nonapeptide repeat (4 copies)